MTLAERIAIFEAGIAAERERINHIMALPEAVGREGAAMHLALLGHISLGLARELLSLSERGPKPTMNSRVLIPRHLRVAHVNERRSS